MATAKDASRWTVTTQHALYTPGFLPRICYNEWTDQLFKQEGDCVWDDDALEYALMHADREDWPQGCQKTVFIDDKSGKNISCNVCLRPRT